MSAFVEPLCFRAPKTAMSLSTSPILAAAASNDVAATRWLIEHERVHVDQMGDWFAPQGGAAESHGETRGVAPHASSMGVNGVPSHAVNKHVSLERKRRTPLMVAATHGSVDALSYLLNACADPNFRSDDDERVSALHCAASGGSAMSVDCITTLLRFGADGKALDGFGREPADVLPVNGAQHNINGGEARAPFGGRRGARGQSPSSSGSAGSSPPSGEDGAYEPRTVGRGSGGSGGSGGSRQSPASLSGSRSGSAGSFGLASFAENTNVSGRGFASVPGPGPVTVSAPRSVSLDLGQRRHLISTHTGSGPYGTNNGNTGLSSNVSSSSNASLSSHSTEPDVETRLSDDFRMFEFKVRRCSRTRAHDWTECPYTHPGEKARRRDPRRFHYGGAACPEFRKGSCPRGDACEYAHGVFECWLHPSRYRTQLCKDGSRCGRRACFFAHAPNQLRPPTDAFGNVVVGFVDEHTNVRPSVTGAGGAKEVPNAHRANVGGRGIASLATAPPVLSRNAADDRSRLKTMVTNGVAGNGGNVGNGAHVAVSNKGSSRGHASLDLSDRPRASWVGASRASLDLDYASAFGVGLGSPSLSAHVPMLTSSGGGSSARHSDSNGSTGTVHGSNSANDSSGSGSGSGSERGGSSDDATYVSQFGQALPNLPFGTHGSNQTHVPRRRDPPPYGFGAGTPTGPTGSDGLVASGYGNCISRENGGGGPAVAAVALLGGGGGALGGLHAVNGLDPESGVALPSRRSFDERSLFERRNGDRGGNPAAALGPSLLGGMSNLGLRAPRGRHSIDVAGVSSKYGWDANAGANAGAEPEIISSRVDRDPPPSREAISALLRGGVGAEAPATAGERRPGAAAVAGSKPGGGDKKTHGPGPGPGAPPHMGPRNSSFQHLGMIEGVLGDETFLGA